MDSKLIDPLDRELILSDSTWFGHIVKGHPDMAHSRLTVEHAVRQPIEIQVSTYDEDCRVYYGRANKDGRMIAVVADVIARIVKTAYAAEKKKKGVVEWKAP